MTGLVGRTMRRLVAVALRHPLAVVIVALGLGLAGVGVTLVGLRFEASELHLLPAGQGYVERYRKYSRAFGELDELVIVVRGQSLPQSAAFAGRLVDTLRAGPIRFNHLSYRVSPQDFGAQALLHLSRASLEGLRGDIDAHGPFFESFAAAPGLVTVIDGVSQEFAGMLAARFVDLGVTDDAPTARLAFLHTLLARLRDTLRGRTVPASPWAELLGVAEVDEAEGYFTSDDKRLLFVFADPVGGAGGFANDLAAVNEIRTQVATLAGQFPGLRAGVTGGPALDADGMRAAFHDSELASVLALALTFGLLLFAFRRCREPGIMLGVLALSLTWSLGLTTVLVGHLTVFSVMFISIVIGLGIDYGIYVLFRYDEERGHGAGVAEAFEVTALRSGPGIALGAVTAAATFYVLLVTDFHGVQELGFIAGTALLCAFVAMVVVFPAALCLLHRGRVVPGDGASSRVAILEALRRRRWVVVAAAVVLTGLALRSARDVAFDYDVLNLQPARSESVAWERTILDAHGRSSYAALATATSLEELRAKRAAFAALPTVADVDSALLFLPDEPEAKVRILGDIARSVGPLRLGRPPEIDVRRLTGSLERLRRRLAIVVAEAGDDAPADLRDAMSALTEILGHLRDPGQEPVAARLVRYQTDLAREFATLLGVLQQGATARPPTLADIPAEVRRKFVSADGELLLRIHPRVDVWDRAGAEQFINDLRSVDRDVTGTPVLTYESIRRMETASRRGALYAVLVVGAICAVVLRRVRDVALALTPLALGTLWTIGLMPLVGLKLNLANVWGIPLIIGASAEYGINLVTRAAEARTRGGPEFAASTVRAVAFNGLSTITGFGVLMVADHRGIWSLGLLLTLGSVASLIAALIVLPACYTPTSAA